MKNTAAAVVCAAMILSAGAVSPSSLLSESSGELVIATYDYTYLSSISSSLSISGKSASCTSNVYGVSGTTKIKVTQTLQKKSGGSWKTVTSWSGEYSSWYCNYYNSYSSLAKGTYRLKTVATVYNGSGSEKVTSYSSNVKC